MAGRKLMQRSQFVGQTSVNCLKTLSVLFLSSNAMTEDQQKKTELITGWSVLMDQKMPWNLFMKQSKSVIHREISLKSFTLRNSASKQSSLNRKHPQFFISMGSRAIHLQRLISTLMSPEKTQFWDMFTEAQTMLTSLSFQTMELELLNTKGNI